MNHGSPVGGTLSGFDRCRPPSPQRTTQSESVPAVVGDLSETLRRQQVSPRTSPSLPCLQPPQTGVVRPFSSAIAQLPDASTLIDEFALTLPPMSPNRQRVALSYSKQALAFIADSSPDDPIGAKIIAVYGGPALVAAVSLGDLDMFERLRDRCGPALQTLASASSAWLVRAAAAKGSAFANALLKHIALAQWPALMCEDDCSAFKSLLKNRDRALLAELFAAASDAQLETMLKSDPHAVTAAMRNWKMAPLLAAALKRIKIALK